MSSLRLIFPAVAIVFVAGCRGSDDVMDENTFAGMYAHVLILRSTVPDSASAATQIAQYLASRNLDREKMMAQLKTYEKSPERYRRVLQLIEDSLRAAKK